MVAPVSNPTSPQHLKPTGRPVSPAQLPSMDRSHDESAGGSDAPELVRFKVSIGGKFEQTGLAWKYSAGETFLESVPATAGYAELVFRLAEKVDGAVSLKYQLPGEALDPDSLITVADDGDVEELFDEYQRALRLPGTPVRTFRLRLFLFPAAEDAYTPEDLAAAARYMGSGGPPPAGAPTPHGSLMSSASDRGSGPRESVLARAFARAAASAALPAPSTSTLPSAGCSTATCSEAGGGGGPGSPGDASPSPADTELAWEAGFLAGQEAAAAAVAAASLAGLESAADEEAELEGGTSDEWQRPLNRRMARLARAASDYMLGTAWAAEGGAALWAADAPPYASGARGSQRDDGATAGAPPPAGRPAVSLAVVESETSAEFQSMFESKYELRAEGAGAAPGAAPPPAAAAQRGGGRPPPAVRYRTQSWAVDEEGAGSGGTTTGGTKPPSAGDGRASPKSLLPTHISAFGEDNLGLVPGEPRAGGAAHAGTPGMAAHRLPSHISEFGGEEPGVGEPGLMSVVKAALPDDDLLPGAADRAPPDAARLPRSFELLAAATEAAASAGPSPGPGAEAGGEMQRSPSVEELLSKVQRVDASQVTVLSKLGEGTFGEVSLAECPTYGRVAVKWIKPTKVERHWASFWREAELMSRLNHPNVLRFFGLVVSGPLVVGIMTEYARGGSLAAYLRSVRASAPGYLPLRRRAELALHAANGMAYLHSQKVVHFDVKPDNLLVDGDPAPGAAFASVKVADFGLSKHKYGTFCSNVHDLRGTLPYMAPEMITDHTHVTEAADVWSLGVVLWELLTLEAPFATMQPAQLIGALSLGKLRLPVPTWCEPEWRALMESCWITDPRLRPSCATLARQLERIRDLAPLT